MPRNSERLWRAAEKLFHNNDFIAAISAYEEYASESGDEEANCRIALCHIYLKEFKLADRVSHRILDADPHCRAAIMIAAYLDLFFERKTEALKKYAFLLKSNYHETRVKKILAIIRETGEVMPLLSSREPSWFLPIPFKTILIKQIFLSIILISIVIIAIVLNTTGSKKIVADPTPSEELVYNDKTLLSAPPALELEKIYLFDIESDKRNSLTSKEIARQFDKLKALIDRKDINNAILLNNDVQNSSINPILKEKFSLLASAIPYPDFASFKNNISLATMLKNEDQYKNVWLKHFGILSNIRERGEVTVFDFTFTDSVDENTWTAEVYLEKPGTISLRAGESYILLGRFRGNSKLAGKPVFQGILLQQKLANKPGAPL